MSKEISDEFVFLRDKLERLASLLVKGEIVEAAFVVGCLQNICHENAEKYIGL